MTLRCAILDDYQNVALKMADWSALKGKADITVFNEHLGEASNVVKALKDFDIVCAMRERTPFRRETVEALPKLKLLLTSGARNASFDMEALKERGVVVCGTGGFGNPTAGIAIGLMLELTRKIGFENARMKAGEKWQVDDGTGRRGADDGHRRPRQARLARRRDRQGARHEGQCLEPEPDQGESATRPASATCRRKS